MVRNPTHHSGLLTWLLATVLVSCPCCTVLSDESLLRLTIQDADSGAALAARVYLANADGKHFFFTPDRPGGSCVSYDKRNWINQAAVESHTTVSAHRCQVSLPPGQYQLTVERGKAYLPCQRAISVDSQDIELQVPLRRWCAPQQRGWYSGDTHLHRTISELRNIILAEDLNVALPLTNWVTLAGKPPTAGDKNQAEIPQELITVDPLHVIWPRNTEYEIFSVGARRHTLGALFALGHRQGIEVGVPPWRPVVEALASTDPQTVYDMDKLDWPFAMLLPTIVPGALYELSNNHVWRTEFSFRDWNTAAPAYMQPPFGAEQGGHRQWIDYTLEMYYTLLNCGLRVSPTAGTANGVHPVPAGFSRVYVYQPDGFRYDDWLQGLAAGRSFVTTGPMLYASVDGHPPGHRFESESPRELTVHIEAVSEQPLSYGEVLVNGRPETLLRPTNQAQTAGGYRSEFEIKVQPERSGWLAVRFWEPRPDGQSRFVHSAPWYVRLGDQPVQPRAHEKRYLVERMTREMERCQGILSPAAMQEYAQALAYYEALVPWDDSAEVAAEARSAEGAELEHWLDTMIVDHRFDVDEIRHATGLSAAAAQRAMRDRTARKPAEGFRLVPYPGGRHPRRGFLEGAIRPQRETKLSLFTPWTDGGYAVVDLPEAIFSNLGLTYLAHEHIPTVWTAQDIELPKLEWEQVDSTWTVNRVLPNGIGIRSEAWERDDSARMRLSLTNGTQQPLTDLRVQVCVLLKGALGFNAQDPLTTVSRPPWIAVRARDTPRWIITAWQPNQRVWTNPPVPCIHSDPVFPDCAPGQTVSVAGGLWFYEGDDIQQELRRLARTGWEDDRPQ